MLYSGLDVFPPYPPCYLWDSYSFLAYLLHGFSWHDYCIAIPVLVGTSIALMHESYRIHMVQSLHG